MNTIFLCISERILGAFLGKGSATPPLLSKLRSVAAALVTEKFVIAAPAARLCNRDELQPELGHQFIINFFPSSLFRSFLHEE